MRSSFALLCLVIPFMSYASDVDEAKAAMWRSIRAAPDDLAIRPERWDTRFPLSVNESLLENPARISPTLRDWRGKWNAEMASNDTIQFAGEILKVSDVFKWPANRHTERLTFSSDIPEGMRESVSDLVSAVMTAQDLIVKAREAIAPEERERLLAAWRDSVIQKNFSFLEDAASGSAGRFKIAPYLQAAWILSSTVDQELPKIRAAASKASFKRHRFLLPHGDFLISGGGDDVYTRRDLENVSLLLDLGGKSRYTAPVSAASFDQIRLTIDLSANVEVQASTAPSSVAAAMWGVALAYFPQPGVKRFETGDFSQGAALFGVAGLFASSDGGLFESRRFTQGAGAFGVGICRISGSQNQITTRLAGQGHGNTQGVGLFDWRGDDGRLTGGLFYADPREELAFISLSQGMGYGPRAYAAGGVGLAYIRGNRNRLETSYMGQGAGYWRGVGGLFVDGNENRLIARRYDQGTGVHSAVGGFFMRGDKNQTMNWGVGPAYGWDFGIGVAEIEGNDNALQTEWGSIHGHVNGHGLFHLKGNQNTLIVPSMGSGFLSRNAASYGTSLIEGSGNVVGANFLSAPMSGVHLWTPDLWGSMSTSAGVTLDPALKLSTYTWPTPDRASQVADEQREMERRLKIADDKSKTEAVGDWMRLAASFGLDDKGPKKAIQRLVTLSDEDLTATLQSYTGESVDQLLVLRHVLASYGPKLGPIVREAVSNSSGTRKALLVSLFVPAGIEGNLDFVSGLVSHSDWRVRRAALAVLGSWVNLETGRTQGRLAFLRQLREWIDDGSFPKTQERFQKEVFLSLGEKYGADVSPILALNSNLSRSDFWPILKPISHLGPADATGLYGLVKPIIDDGKVYRPLIDGAIQSAERAKVTVVLKARAALRDPDSEVRHAALLVLGQTGDSKTIDDVASFASDGKAYLREAALTSLAKYGKASGRTYSKWLKSNESRQRIQAIVSIVQNGHSDSHRALLDLFDDSSTEVRRTLAAALSWIVWDNHPHRQAFGTAVKKALEKEKDGSVRLVLMQSRGFFKTVD